MDKFKMELTWHNCKICQPEEDSNGCLIITNGKLIYQVAWSRFWQGFGSPSIEIKDEDLINWWWADIIQTVHKTKEFKENESKANC
jgi:hypothetical protein